MSQQGQSLGGAEAQPEANSEVHDGGRSSFFPPPIPLEYNREDNFFTDEEIKMWQEDYPGESGNSASDFWIENDHLWGIFMGVRDVARPPTEVMQEAMEPEHMRFTNTDLNSKLVLRFPLHIAKVEAVGGIPIPSLNGRSLYHPFVPYGCLKRWPEPQFKHGWLGRFKAYSVMQAGDIAARELSTMIAYLLSIGNLTYFQHVLFNNESVARERCCLNKYNMSLHQYALSVLPPANTGRATWAATDRDFIILASFRKAGQNGAKAHVMWGKETESTSTWRELHCAAFL